ncbi:glycoside hydrolase family 108 protein [Dankookia sp. GCM10030260]|uniref:glycoside hydrolase family 108 protein n=1 Tax=Dankookia sp. GCM10030260 TaxID=3273390 RepID=UPI003612BC8C
MLPLVPLISLASSLVPDLVGLFGGRRAGELAGRVAAVVQSVAGTDDIDAAAKAVRADAAKASELTLRLEEVRREYLDLQAKDRQAERQSIVEALRIELDDRRRASGAMVGALGAEGWTARAVALGPAAVSVIVMLGFFVFTGWLVRDPPAGADATTLTLLNVVVGSLVAGFTAVVNFWLGSSQGSRDKDRAAAALRQGQAGAGKAVAEPAPAAPVPPAAGPQPGQPSRFDLCLPIVLAKEGGFADDPADPGGATQMGITQRTLAAWRGRPVTTQEVRDLTRAEAKEIYRAQYWNLMRCEDLPRGLDLVIFDFGVNAGPGTAVKTLQRAVGTVPDGAVGPFTLQAARAADARALVGAVSQARLEHCRGLTGFARFGAGWTSRIEDIRRQALLMVAA